MQLFRPLLAFSPVLFYCLTLNPSSFTEVGFFYSLSRGGKTPPRLYLPCLLFVLCGTIFEKEAVSFGESAFVFEQPRRDKRCKRHGQDYAEASRDPLHNFDTYIVGVKNLIKREIISIIYHQRDHRASGKRQNQRIGHCPHNITSNVYP